MGLRLFLLEDLDGGGSQQAKQDDDRADAVGEAGGVEAGLGVDLDQGVALGIGHLDVLDGGAEGVIGGEVDVALGDGLDGGLGDAVVVLGTVDDVVGDAEQQHGAEQGDADGLAHVAHGGLDAARLGGVALVHGQGDDVVGLGGRCPRGAGRCSPRQCQGEAGRRSRRRPWWRGRRPGRCSRPR